MNQQFIKIDEKEFSKLIAEFEAEIKEMSNLLEEVDDSTRNYTEVWDGDDSEKVMVPFTEFKKEFIEVNDTNRKYLEFFQSVIDKYKLQDSSTSSYIDDSANSFDFVGK